MKGNSLAVSWRHRPSGTKLKPPTTVGSRAILVTRGCLFTLVDQEQNRIRGIGAVAPQHVTTVRDERRAAASSKPQQGYYEAQTTNADFSYLSTLWR